MRDLKKDLELCEKATSGAWESSPAGNWYGAEVNYWQVSSDHAIVADLINNKYDAEFIAEAREALPYWLGIVQELQKEIDNFLTFGQGGAGFRESQLIAELAKKEAQLAAMLERMRKLETVKEAAKNVVDNINLPASKVVKMWLELKEALASLDGDNA